MFLAATMLLFCCAWTYSLNGSYKIFRDMLSIKFPRSYASNVVSLLAVVSLEFLS